ATRPRARTKARSATHPTSSDAVSLHSPFVERLLKLVDDGPVAGGRQFHDAGVDLINNGIRWLFRSRPHAHVNLRPTAEGVPVIHKDRVGCSYAIERAAEPPVPESNRLPCARDGLDVGPFGLCGLRIFIRQLEIHVAILRLRRRAGLAKLDEFERAPDLNA